QLFQTLNTPPERRFRTLDEQLAAFPYVDGRLFAEPLPLAAFDRRLREWLLDACALDWSRISPAIFGSLFQSILDPAARRHLGAHYTSETHILKALRPLFLDRLRAEFERIRRNPKRLFEFQKKLASLRVLDPACGCGNFLVVAYRELRLLELEVLRELVDTEQILLDVSRLVFVDVDQFYGIELEEFPAQIAQVALWLTDHQMNLRVSEAFGQYFVRLPLTKAPNIVHGNALALDWREIVRPEELSVIVGNPPFVGKAFQSEAQKTEIAVIFQGVKGFGVLDYVACWYRKAADVLADNPAIRAAFVSTNSITQGEQAGVLWPDLFRRGVRIHFAHRTFQWSSEARGKAAAHCVIVGFGLEDELEKWLFDYDTPKSEPHAIRANNINPYLVDAANVVLDNRRSPISPVPSIVFGSMPNDGGHLLLSPAEKEEFIAREPKAARWLRRLLGSEEFINGRERWCLWLVGISPDELRAMPAILERVEAVRRDRLASTRATTRELAATPALFGEIRHPSSGEYVLIPSVSSERRPFIPVDILPAEVISTNLNLIIPHATLYHFGVLSSTMHMAWVRAVCGRLKSDYRYSAGIVYNNFPWPAPTDPQRQTIATAAQAVLDARARFPSATLADLYDPLTMPPELLQAHRRLDRAVDAAYGKTAFASEAERVAFLFERYRQLTSLLPEERSTIGRKRKSR
ncbi:MAG: class I SAM-dependent DNA methyltransferase, partial [Candidatus Competibacter sp.]|nr:class I SAM-dependent DNA methyltransferase [Candidatus Competibacter sp.]